MLEKTQNIFVTYEIQILLFINKILLKKRHAYFHVCGDFHDTMAKLDYPIKSMLYKAPNIYDLDL